MEAFRGPHFQNGLNEWNAYDVEVSDFFVHVKCYHDHSQKVGGPSQDPRGLMLHNRKRYMGWEPKVDGVRIEFSLASEGTKVSIHTLHALLGLTT